jgi:hypothetical protein
MIIMIIFNISISYFHKISFHYLGKVVSLFWKMFTGCPNKWCGLKQLQCFFIFPIKILFWCLNCFV